MVHTCNPSTREVEAGGPEGHPQPYRAGLSLGYIGPCKKLSGFCWLQAYSIWLVSAVPQVLTGRAHTKLREPTRQQTGLSTGPMQRDTAGVSVNSRQGEDAGMANSRAM